MSSESREMERLVRTLAHQAGLVLQPHHVPGVVESYARLTAQGALIMDFDLDESEEPAPVYAP